MARPTRLEAASDGSPLGVSTIDSPSITGIAGHLYIAHISATRGVGSITVSSVTGLGLTWAMIKDQCNGVGVSQDVMSVWYAIGAASTGVVTATLSAASQEVQIYVTRWGGVDTSDPIGAAVGYNTNGIDGACSGGTPSDDAGGSITVEDINSVVLLASVQDDSTAFTMTPGWTTETAYSGQSVQSIIIEYRPAPQGALTLGSADNLSTTDQWALVAIEIRGDPSPAPIAIRVYDGISAAPMGALAGYGEVEIAFDGHGPAEATITMPRNSSHLAAGRLFPGGKGVFVEIDARGLGVPAVWTGRAVSPQASSTSPTVTLRCAGPQSWLDRETIGGLHSLSGSAGDIMRAVIDQHPVPLRVRVGQTADGLRGGEVQADGQTVWGLADSLASDRMEAWTLTAVPGGVGYTLEWWAAADMRDRTGEIVLVESVNCEWSIAYNLNPALGDWIAVGDSFAMGRGGAQAAMMSTPATAVLGRRAALTAALQSPIAATVRGAGGGALVRPDIASRAALESALEAKLRAAMTPMLAATVEVLADDDTRASLWSIRPGDLVSTRWASEPTGVYSDAIALVRTVSYSVAPVMSCNLSVELWATR